MEDYLLRKQIKGFTCPNLQIQGDLFVMFKLRLLFCVDDTVLISESASDLQESLNVFSNYNVLWIMETACQYSQNEGLRFFSKGPIS